VINCWFWIEELQRIDSRGENGELWYGIQFVIRVISNLVADILWLTYSELALTVSKRTPGQRQRLILHLIHASLPNTHF
jgi:hypothetical protein